MFIYSFNYFSIRARNYKKKAKKNWLLAGAELTRPALNSARKKRPWPFIIHSFSPIPCAFYLLNISLSLSLFSLPRFARLFCVKCGYRKRTEARRENTQEVYKSIEVSFSRFLSAMQYFCNK